MVSISRNLSRELVEGTNLSNVLAIGIGRCRRGLRSTDEKPVVNVESKV